MVSFVFFLGKGLAVSAWVDLGRWSSWQFDMGSDWKIEQMLGHAVKSINSSPMWKKGLKIFLLASAASLFLVGFPKIQK